MGIAGQASLASRVKPGAGGENRTRDLPLTKGLRYHYATPATGGLKARGSAAITQGWAKGKGFSLPKSGKSEARRERLEGALRANLKRRKARERALDPAPDGSGATDLSAEGLDKTAARNQIKLG